MRRLRKYLELTPAGRAVFLRSLFLLPAVAALVRTRGMAHTTTLLEGRERRSECDLGALAPREIARIVDATATLLHTRCLSRSMVLWHLLRRRSTAAEIRLGVSKSAEGKLAAHAWVELNGMPLNDNTGVLMRFAVLPLRGQFLN